MDSHHTVSKAHSLILQDEKQWGAFKRSTHIAETSAFAVKNSRNSYRNFTPRNPLMTLLSGNKTMTNHVNRASTKGNLLGTPFCALFINKGICWILDTGVISHIVYSADLFTTSSCGTKRNVHLPNGVAAVVTHIGSVCFANFILHNVLCVPSFKLNLISITKLAQNFHCSTTFTNNSCML